MTRTVLAACGGFLLAVLWFDLMFDVQVLGQSSSALPESVLASTAGYYRRVTVEAFPMNRLVAGVMLVGLAFAGARVARRRRALDVAAFALLAVPIALAGARIVPAAQRLGMRLDSPEVQSELARSIFYEHVFCFAAIAVFLAVVLASREKER
jgi:hypothetical protein